MLYMWWVAIRVQHHTIPSLCKGSLVRRECWYWYLVCIIHCYVMIGTSPTSYLYQIHSIHKRWLTYSVCVGQSYECVFTPPITMICPSLESLVLMFGRMVMAIVGCKFFPQTTYTHIKSIILYIDTSCLDYFI